MNEGSSIRASSSSFSRLRPESGRLHTNECRWFFDQVHVRNLIFYSLLFLLFCGLIGLLVNSQLDFYEPIPIPLFDGKLLFSTYHRKSSLPNIHLSKMFLNAMSYIFVFSSISGFIGIKYCELSAERRRRSIKFPPYYLLIPSALSQLMFVIPLLLWILRSSKSAIDYLMDNEDGISPIKFIDAFRYLLIPICIITGFYVYFIYGIFIGVIYYKRRCTQKARLAEFSSSVRRDHLTARRNTVPTITNSSIIRYTAKGGPSNLVEDDAHHAAVRIHSSLNKSGCASPSSAGFVQHLETVDEERDKTSDSS